MVKHTMFNADFIIYFSDAINQIPEGHEPNPLRHLFECW